MEVYLLTEMGCSFHMILNYLRGNISSVEQLSYDRIILSDLSSEAKFYQLKGLCEILKSKEREICTRIPTYESFDSPDSACLCLNSNIDI